MSCFSNKIIESGKKLLISVGKNNKPIYAVMTIAVANGIFKPLSSLTDKKEKPEARKYAALREFMTEVVAVPTYWLCGVGAAKLGEKMFKANPEKKAIAKTNMMFLGVCTAAVFVIPALCSLVLGAMNLNRKKERFAHKKLDITSKSPDIKVTVSNQNLKTDLQTLLNPRMETFTNRGGLKI